MLNVLNRDYQMGFNTLNTRVHGPLFGALSAPRYLAYIRGMVTSRHSETLAPNEEIIMVPEGFPLPDTTQQLQTRTTDGGRTIHWFQREQRFNPKQVRLQYNGQPCDVQLPYHWFHLPATEQALFGFPTTAGLEYCSGGAPLDGSLEITVRRIRDDKPLTLLLAWYDVQHDYTAETTVEMSHDGTRWTLVTGQSPMQSVAIYSVPTPDINTPVRIRIQPVKAIANIDLY